MSRISIAFLLLASLFLFGSSQMTRFPAAGKHICSDPMGNIYIYDSASLSAYNPRGTFTARYTRLFEHEISSVDVSNPFKILLFDRSNQTLMFLDKQLSAQQNAGELRDLGVSNALAACSASDNGFWILDEDRVEIKRFDKFLNLVFSTQQRLSIPNADGLWMQEHSNRLLIYHPQVGLITLDEFGNKLDIMPLTGISSPSAYEGQFYGISAGILVQTDLQTKHQSTIPLPPNTQSVSASINGLLMLQQGWAEITPWPGNTGN